MPNHSKEKRLAATLPPAKAKQRLDNHEASRAVLDWYDHNRRNLPWRMPPGKRADPYHVWLSEIMLQQTTVEAVKPYFEKFIQRWPRLADFAAATQDDVLRLWAGLGYYSRARNMHRAAQVIVTEHDGAFPETETALRALPGVGDYTAAAIAAISFGQRALVCDANIERIMARYGAVADRLPAAKPAIRAVLDRMTPSDRAGDFAQALMDIGNRICTPPRRKGTHWSQPQCLICPLAASCLGRHQDPSSWPRKAPKKDRATRQGHVMVVISDDQQVLLMRRPSQGLLGGMMLFPTSNWPDGSRAKTTYPIEADSLLGQLEAHLAEHPRRQVLNTPVEHIFSHFALSLTVTRVTDVRRQDLKGVDAGGIWHPMVSLDQEALPSVMRKVFAMACG
jgi:A/G-specific adenine glycosylase